MKPLRFATVGAGFWSRYQLSAWRELEGVECVALCDKDHARAARLAGEAGIPAAFDDAEAMLDRERPDVLDIITDVDSHARLVRMALGRGIAVVCQKPLAPTLAEAEGLVAACQEAGVPLLVHENWRWQAPIRAFKDALGSGRIGRPFRARIDFCSGFDVFGNQPFLRELEQFILTDIGTHILDVARFLFGEADGLFATTHKAHAEIRGEDVATVLLTMASGATVVCNLAYAGNALEVDRFPETFIFVEADAGSAALGPDFTIRETTPDGTRARRVPPHRYPWAHPEYDLIHASMVPCLRNLANALRGEGEAETTGADNLKTLRLVFESYRSAAERRFLPLSS